MELRAGAVLAEDARKLGTNARVPVDQRAVAVEGCPAGHSSKRLITIVALCPPKPNEFDAATSSSGTGRASFGT